jgi:hypothetical protein
VEFETRGVPTVGLFTEAFSTLASVVADALHVGDLPMVVTPHPMNNQPEDFIRSVMRDRILAVADGLTLRP